MNQAAAFLGGMGDEYYGRNIQDLGKRDPIDALLIAGKIKPKAVLEIGCANGWRLKKLHDRFGCQVRGIDPSRQACDDGNRLLGHKWILQGVAEALPYTQPDFDLIIFGFSLWLCDPHNLFQIVANADRVLADKGYLVIHDFIPPKAFKYQYAPPHASKAERQLWAWCCDHHKFWAAHPSYRVLMESYQHKKLSMDRILVLEGVTLLQKDYSTSFPAMAKEGE